MPQRRPLLGAALAAAILVSGCSHAITTSGLPIDKSSEVVDAALVKVQQDNASGIQDQSVTISDDTRCYYTRTSKESDDVSTSLTCGPIRRIGLAEGESWDTYGVQFSQDAKGKVTGTLGEMEGAGQAVDTSLLVRPDGKKPAEVTKVPEPQAPRTDVTDAAAIIGTESAGNISFSDLDTPWVIHTPAATIEVTATAMPDFLPSEMVAPGSGENGPAVPYYRPADGQRALAFKVKVGPGPRTGDATDSSGRQLVALDTSLDVIVSGRSLPVQDLTGSAASGSADQSTYTIPCASGGWSSYPCDRAETTPLVMVASVATDAKPGLAARVDGETQSVDLSSGVLTSSVSQLDYSAGDLAQDIGKLMKVDPVTLPRESFFGDGKDTCSWSVTLSSAALESLDPYTGWAKPGRAWLVLHTEEHYPEGECTYFEDVNYLSTVTSGKDVYRVAAASTSGRRVFNVPDSFTEGVFRWRPKGTFNSGESSRAFSAKAAEQTVEFDR